MKNAGTLLLFSNVTFNVDPDAVADADTEAVFRLLSALKLAKDETGVENHDEWSQFSSSSLSETLETVGYD